jgi:hypothetical protein
VSVDLGLVLWVCMSTQILGRAQESWALKSLCEVTSGEALCVGLLAYF